MTKRVKQAPLDAALVLGVEYLKKRADVYHDKDSMWKLGKVRALCTD